MDTKITLKPLIDESAIVVENEHKALVIADLHLGIEAEFRQKGINIGSQTEKLLERAITCVKAAEPDVIILLGDVKHAVPQILYTDRKEVPFFLARLAEYAPVYIVKGNHDGYIDKLLLEVTEPDWNPNAFTQLSPLRREPLLGQIQFTIYIDPLRPVGISQKSPHLAHIYLPPPPRVLPRSTSTLAPLLIVGTPIQNKDTTP
jgi:hypothetical protein